MNPPKPKPIEPRKKAPSPEAIRRAADLLKKSGSQAMEDVAAWLVDVAGLMPLPEQPPGLPLAALKVSLTKGDKPTRLADLMKRGASSRFLQLALKLAAEKETEDIREKAGLPRPTDTSKMSVEEFKRFRQNSLEDASPLKLKYLDGEDVLKPAEGLEITPAALAIIKGRIVEAETRLAVLRRMAELREFAATEGPFELKSVPDANTEPTPEK